jgi:hypothetical protein
MISRNTNDLFGWKPTTPAEAAKQEDMTRAHFNADEIWKRQMYECVITVARRYQTFTSDDVFEVAALLDYDHGTHDLRAFGPIMMLAAKNHVCCKAECAPINSRRASLHASPRAVWRSLIFRPQNKI